MQLHARITSPKSSLNLDELPKYKGVRNYHENSILKAAEALEDYYKASDELDAFQTEMIANIDRLPFAERVALTYIYYYNLDKAPDKRATGICNFLGIRRRDLSLIVRSAKQHLREILTEQGIEIE